MTETPERAYCDHCEGWQGAHVPMDDDCALPHRYTTKLHPPTRQIGHCCQWCIDRHISQLGEIIDLWAGLASVIPEGSIPTDDNGEYHKPRKAPASPSPIRLEAWAMLHDRERLGTAIQTDEGWEAAYMDGNLPDVPAVLAGWAGWAMEAATQTDTPPTAVSSSAIKLRALGETVACQPWVDEYDAELTWVHRSLRRAHGISQPKRLGRCMTVTQGRDCGGSVWPSTEGKNPTCDRCKRVYGQLDLVRLRITEEGQASA